MKFTLSVLLRYVKKWAFNYKDDIDVYLEIEKHLNETGKGKVS